MDELETIIDVNRLAVGHYIHIDMSWLSHPFAFSHFKITSPEQIRIIRELGRKTIRIDPSKSSVTQQAAEQPPLPEEPEAAQQAAIAAQEAAMAKKRERIASNHELRTRISVTEKKFIESAKVCKELAKSIFFAPAESIARANEVVTKMADALLTDSDAIIHLLGDKIAGEEVYHHSLNVATLTVLLGKALNAPRPIIEQVGLAAILHDLGKVEITDRVLLKKEPWTKPERDLYQTHVMHSVNMVKKAGVSKEALLIIAQHHEMIDGSGFPGALTAPQINLGAKLLSLVNVYDNLCNPVDIASALTPHEALSQMFTKQRARFDGVMLGKLVHLLGVYPPGTVVVLSNEAIGMVLSINSSKPLRPVVMVYDPDIPRAEAVTVNLEEEKDISISKALRPGQLARPVFDYLSPRQRITYSFDQSKRGGKPA